MRDTTTRGDICESAVAAALIRQGKKLLRPMSSAMRYDLLIDQGDGTFTRVQCKSGVLRAGTVQFRRYSISGHNTRAVGYEGQVDAYGVYCAETGHCYLVPVDALVGSRTLGVLRIVPPRNGQRRKIRMADSFRIE